MHRRNLLAALGLFATATVVSPAAQAQSKEINFGFISTAERRRRRSSMAE